MALSFRPRLVDAVKGYGRDDFAADFSSGITVGVVALPLAMAFGIDVFDIEKHDIQVGQQPLEHCPWCMATGFHSGGDASGVKPEQGIFTAIIAGFLISLLGGSRVQIGGPAGAFVALLYGVVERYGVANLLIATMMAGVLRCWRPG